MAALRQPSREALELVTRARTTTKLRVYLAIATLGAVAALISGRPQLVAATAPLAVYAAVGLRVARRRVTVRLRARAPRARLREGDEFAGEVELTADGDVARSEIVLIPGSGLRGALDRRHAPVRVEADLRAGEPRVIGFPLLADHWGAPRIGTLEGRLRDRFGVLDLEFEPTALGRVGIMPHVETLRTLIDPLRLRATVGSRVARGRGDGIEFAEVREFAPGDPIRRINWRVSARRRSLHVSDRHPELAADVVLLLDTFSDVGDADNSTLALAVRAAAALCAGYLERRDQVGLIGFGGVLTGIGPHLGTAQLERIVAALLASEVQESYAHKTVETVPRRLLPPRALVVALSPLLDGRTIAALLDLRARGFDLAILEVSPEPFLAAPRTREQALALRLWRMRRDAFRDRLRSFGVTVTAYEDGAPLAPVLIQATHARRHVRGALAR